MTTHWSGTRSGWNARGGTAREHLRFEREIGADNPNSNYWKNVAERELERLEILLGDVYELWVEMTWPGESYQLRTWKEIYETAFYTRTTPKEIEQALSCTCNGVMELCQAQARISYANDNASIEA